MSAKQKKFTYLILVLLMGLAVILTCSDKIINTDETHSVEFEMSVKFSDEQQQSIAEVVQVYQVTIIADADTIIAVLDFNDGIVTGLIENVPAGPGRIVIVEGLTSDGTVLYRGTTTVTVVEGQVVDAVVTLTAVGKLVRITPKYRNQNYGSEFTGDVKVDNISGLTALVLNIAYDASVINIDSVKKGTNVPTGVTFTSDIATLSNINIQTNHTSTIVDSSGDVTLATLFFTPKSSGNCLDSSILDLTVNSLTAPATTTSDIYVDDALVRVSRGKLALSPNSLAFGAGVEGLNLDFKQIDVTDSCGNAIAFTISTETEWVDLNPAQAGLTPGSFYIDVDTNGLNTGSYAGAVTVSAPRAINSPYDIEVTLDIDKGARIINVTPDTLYFVATENDELPIPQDFQVSEFFGFNISFEASEDIPWLELSGVSSVTKDTITASITSTALDYGTYNGTIQISSAEADNSPQSVAVVYTVNKGPRVIATSPIELNFEVTEFGELPEDQTFQVIETGGYTIPYSASENISWLALSDISGSTDDTVTASVTLSVLPGGVYTDSILISSIEANNSPIYLRVNLHVTPATRNLQSIPDTLYFYALQDEELPAAQSLIIKEVIGYPTTFSASENSNLFDISGISGNTPDTITVSVLTTSLEEGTYIDSITITSEQADNSPKRVAVVYTVEIGERVIAVEPDSIHLNYTEFSGEFPTSQFIVKEVRDYALPFDAIGSISWLSLSKLNGTTEDTIMVSTQPEIGAGIYVDSIMISSAQADNSPIFVVVTLEVQEALKFLETDVDSVYLQYIEYSDAFPVGYVNISEQNNYSIPFDATEDVEWMILADIGQATPDRIEIHVSTAFEPGVYVDSVMISSGEAENSPLYVKVVYEIVDQPQPMLLLSPDTLHFLAQENGGLPASDVFTVLSSLYPTFYRTTETIDWLDLDGDSGTTGNSVTVNITSTTLQPNVYFDSIYVYTEDINFINTYEYIEYTIVDTIPPSTVTDLSVDSTSPTSAFLGWTSSGDDENVGTATETDLRYSTNLNTLLSWTGATQVNNEPGPQPSGSSEQFEVTGLTPGNTYYFALEIFDNVGNASGISNVDSVYIPLLAPDIPNLVSPLDGAINLPINFEFVWNSSNGANYYELQYDTNLSFASAVVSDNLSDTTLLAGPLEYEITHYWRVRAKNSDAMSDWSAVWSFTTEPTPPTIAGIVKDDNGAAMQDVLVKIFDSYPDGSIVDSTFSDQNGRFEFFDLTGSFDLYAFKTGHYPEVLTINAPDTNLLIELAVFDQLSASAQWVDLYCESALAHGHPIQVNDVVEAFDPDGVLCGRYVVNTTGAYGNMRVYRDDISTAGVDEGFQTHDLVILKVNQEISITGLPIVYPEGTEQQIEACFDVTGAIPKFIVIFEPEGGETFYVDSSITLLWSSTGIAGPLELLISNSIVFPIPQDTIDNDGEHTFNIPDVAEADDWSISLVDIDEAITGTSNVFTISKVNLESDKSSLFFHSTVEGCLPGQKQFVLTANDSLNIPFEIEDTISWLSITPLSGTTPEIITVSTLPNALPLGTYQRNLVINSESAHNSPLGLETNYEVGDYFCGDFDGDCQLQVSDITNLVNYLYRGGPAPLYPEAMNVDLCDEVDIADVDYFYSIVNLVNPPICEGADVCTNIANDLGVRDSLRMELVSPPDASDSIPSLQIDLYLFNDANTLNGLSSGFGWDNPNMVLDSVVLSQTVENNVAFRFVYEEAVRDTTNANQRFLFAVYKTILNGIPPSANSKLLASYYFSLSSWSEGDSINVDLLEFGPGATFKASTANGSYSPEWGGTVSVTK